MIDKETILSRVKRRLSVKDNTQDDLINDLIDDVVDLIKEFCNNDFVVNEVEDIPLTLTGTIIDLCIWKNKRLNGKVVTSESIGDYSVSYGETVVEDIPATIKNVLYRYRKMRVW